MDRETLHDAHIPVLGLGRDKPGDLRRQALELLVNRPFSAKAWRSAEALILDLLDKRNGVSDRTSLLELAVRVPLQSVRESVRRIARDSADPDAVTARGCLAQVGENRFANILIDDFRQATATEDIARSLAKSPLDRMRVSTPKLEAKLEAMDLDDPWESTAYLWGSIALGKKGRFKHLNKVMRGLEHGWRPGILWGNPFYVHDELRTAAFDSGRLLDYAEKMLKRLDPEDRSRLGTGDVIGDARLNVLDALLARPSDQDARTSAKTAPDPGEAVGLIHDEAVRNILERNLKPAMERGSFHDIVPNALRDVTANLHELAPEVSNEYLPVVIGNYLVDLTSRLPAFEPDGSGIIRAYRTLAKSTTGRSLDFETQLGWIIAQGDFATVMLDCEDLLDSDDDLEQTIAWSITSKGSAFASGQPPPIFGAGTGGMGGKPLWAEIDLHGLAKEATNVVMDHSASRTPASVRAIPPGSGDTSGAAGPGDEEPAADGSRSGTDTGTGGGDPPRSAYALLDCPDEVEPMVEFVVTVGLRENPTPGVVAPLMHRPDWSIGNYKLKVSLLYDGFMLRSGEISELILDVTTDAPYPEKSLHLTAVAGEQFKESRTLMAQYSIEGQFIGSAARPIVVKKAGGAQVSANLARGFDLSMPPGVPTPDMTISITKGNTFADDRLVWNIMTPHDQIDVTRPDEKGDYQSDIGSAPDAWARTLMNAINAHPAAKPLELMMIGNGREIRKAIPLWVRQKLRELSKLFPDPAAPRPTVFIVSDEPNIPWELVYLEPDAPDGAEEFLGVAFVVGRWVHGYENVDGNRVPAYPPPVEISVESMAVVSGDYSNTKNWRALKGAEQEAKALVKAYNASAVNADGGLAEWLSKCKDVEAIHFAVHGKWSVGGSQDGIVLVDGTYLTAKEVLGARLERRPFVFLNACQLGQGEQTLGNYGGIAAAFLEAGASGVIAALWNVDDTEAKNLALDFYSQTKVGQAGPGEVFRALRSGFRNNTRSKLSLAYQFFGHPQMRMTLKLP